MRAREDGGQGAGDAGAAGEEVWEWRLGARLVHGKERTVEEGWDVHFLGGADLVVDVLWFGLG